MPSIYLAGELFSLKHLAGNAALAGAISAHSGQRYRCILPQDLPQLAATTPRSIRDQDLRALVACDAAVFHYDGLELDSGTVVEYLYAKFADLPAVLLRTDFRHAGDQREGDPWNLMNSFFPRTEVVWLNSMELYHASRRDPAALTQRVAAEVCAALDKVMVQPPALPRDLGPAVYEWLALMPAFEDAPAAREEFARLYRNRMDGGVF